jgi:hypothetical protein
VALTVQKKLELAGDLAKVRPLLQRLHLVEEPKKRLGGRGIILVVSVISAIGVLTAVAVLWRRARLDVAVAVADESDDLQTDLSIEDMPAEDALPTTV